MGLTLENEGPKTVWEDSAYLQIKKFWPNRLDSDCGVVVQVAAGEHAAIWESDVCGSWDTMIREHFESILPRYWVGYVLAGSDPSTVEWAMVHIVPKCASASTVAKWKQWMKAQDYENGVILDEGGDDQQRKAGS